MSFWRHIPKLPPLGHVYIQFIYKAIFKLRKYWTKAKGFCLPNPTQAYKTSSSIPKCGQGCLSLSTSPVSYLRALTVNCQAKQSIVLNFVTQPGSMQCPCRLGMTCSTRNTQGRKINGKPYGRCVYITTGPDEVDEDRLLPWLS